MLSKRVTFVKETSIIQEWGHFQSFYPYTYPSPVEIGKEVRQPATASCNESNGSSMAMLRYNDLIKMENPGKELLDFMETAYQASTSLVGWNLQEFEIPALEAL